MLTRPERSSSVLCAASLNGNQGTVGAQVTADMKPDTKGTWLYHCHVNHHIVAGMSAQYTVV